MSPPSLADLTAIAAAAADPFVTARSGRTFGGVDPLGLRQINFNLMDKVLPGFNNVARHVRPFVLITWAWRRARHLAEQKGATLVSSDLLRGFVDRMEVLFVASQVLRDPKVDLPGSDYLRPWLNRPSLSFDGPEWIEQRKRRRDSTSLSAAINYGPGLVSFGWTVPHATVPGIMVPTTEAMPAIDAFESLLTPFLSHEAFSSLDAVTVDRALLEELSDAWTLARVTEAEKKVMTGLMLGATAPAGRQAGLQLMLWVIEAMRDSSIASVRAAMSGAPSPVVPPAHLLDIRDAWRRVQVRQLFRLSLEMLHYWMMMRLEDEPQSMDSLLKGFLDEAHYDAVQGSASAWLSRQLDLMSGPTQLMDRIQAAAELEPEDLVPSILAGLAHCLNEPTHEEDKLQATERLPLFRAVTETEARADTSVPEFTRHILEGWVLAQHAYWSVGRGLADARAGGKVLLRLKIILDDGGWTLTPGAKVGSPPMPTRDRLASALSLAGECGLIA